jgi:hypothetical protein
MTPSPVRVPAHHMFRRILIVVCISVIASVALRAVQQQSSSKSSSNSQSTSSSQTNSSSQSSSSSQNQSSQGVGNMQGMQGMQDMPGMNNSRLSPDGMANEEMTPGHHHMGPHMHMTAPRPATDADWARADQVAATLKDAIEKYKDYHVAEADGFEPFLPNLPQPMYHFTSARNGFLEAFTFDPARPTSLLYKKTATGYELIGAMYTMPLKSTEAELNERIPLGVAQWHLHTNLCMPKRGAKFDQTRFGLNGSIVTQDACTAAGGRFYPTIFGWMVHIYPYESSREKVWEQ